MALALLGAWLALQVTIAWAPFRLDAPRPVDNGAHYLDDGVLVFSGDAARAVSDALLAWDEAGSVDVDLTVRSQRPEQHGPARILTIAHDYRQANLVIGQEGAALIIRVRYPRDAVVGRRDILVPQVFEDPDWQRVSIEIDDTVRVTVNGRTVAVRALTDDTFAAWDPSYRIAVGDEVIGGRPWAGSIQEARLTTGGLVHDLVAPGALEVPHRFWYVPARLRDAVQVPNAPAILQSLLHFLAWIPAGAVFASRLPSRRRIGRVAATAGGLALVLQVGKLVIAGRHPSVLDVATQTSGALIGALLAAMVITRRADRHRVARGR